MTELCDIAWKYKTDKCPQLKHHFTEYYHEMFKDRRSKVKKVVEIGIGIGIRPYYSLGASLLMWREYFENATIYGADINPELLFQDERIQTYLCDQTKADDLYRLIETTGGDIDLFIDDGLHTPDSQVFTCKTLMPLLHYKTVYAIEDVRKLDIADRLGGYDVEIFRNPAHHYADDCLLVVRHA